jgi:hypothetical protein
MNTRPPQGGPTICGIIAEKFGGVQFGFYIVLAVSAFGLLFLILALYVNEELRSQHPPTVGLTHVYAHGC